MKKLLWKLTWKLAPSFLKRALIKRAVKKFMEQEEGKAYMELIKSFLSSKKAAALLSGILALVLRELIGLDEATVQMLVNLIIGYFVSQGAVDIALVIRNKKTK